MQTQTRTRRVSWTVAIAAVLALLAVGIVHFRSGANESGDQYRYTSSTSAGQTIPLAKRKLAGNLSGNLISGGSYQLSQDAGKVVVFNYFASWCGPCAIETPNMSDLYLQRKASGVQFVGIDVKEGSKSGAESWIAAKGLKFPIVYDDIARTAIQLGKIPTNAMPLTVVIDKRGRVAGVYVGSVLPKDLTPVLDTLSKEV